MLRELFVLHRTYIVPVIINCVILWLIRTNIKSYQTKSKMIMSLREVAILRLAFRKIIPYPTSRIEMEISIKFPRTTCLHILRFANDLHWRPRCFPPSKNETFWFSITLPFRKCISQSKTYFKENEKQPIQNKSVNKGTHRGIQSTRSITMATPILEYSMVNPNVRLCMIFRIWQFDLSVVRTRAGQYCLAPTQ